MQACIASCEMTPGRSVLFKRTITLRPLSISMIFSSSSFIGTEESATYKIRSAFSIEEIARSTPIFSTLSEVSLIPAVSMIFRLIPWISICSSSISLVVPAISVTMARSSPTRTFRREDFPAFGFPTITVRMPSFLILPLSKERISFKSLESSLSFTWDNSSLYPSRLICSGSSSADSI